MAELIALRTAYRCDSCDEIWDETLGEPLYECGECGTIFSRSNSADGGSHRCPQCNRFAGKLADDGCIECETGEVEEVQALECPHCKELHEPDHIPEGCRQAGPELASFSPG